MYENYLNGSADLEQMIDSIDKSWAVMGTVVQNLATLSPTSKLWIDYQQMIQVVRNLIAADRSGNWQQRGSH